MQPPSPNSVQPLITPDQRAILIAAAGGSILSLLFLGERFTWKLAATAVLSGLFVAYYGVELVAGIFRLGPGYYGALGAGFGFASMTVLAGLSKMLRLWRDDPGAVLRLFLPFMKKGDGK